MNRNPDDLGLELATSDEYGVHFETGVPVTFKFIRSTEKSPNFGSKYGQDIEPGGRYMLHNPDPGRLSRNWEAGTITFQQPLVIPLSGDMNAIYGPKGWKARLHRATGLAGKALTHKLQDLGYDGIVTVDDTGYTREIVDMTTRINPLSDEARKAFIEMRDRAKAKETREVAEMIAMLETSPAIGGFTFGDDPGLAIMSGELYDHNSGPLRVTFFGPDGPRGHNTRKDVRGIAKEILDSMKGPFRPMTEDEVIAFTSSREFVEGSRHVAFIQAENTLRYLAGRAGERYHEESQRAITEARKDAARFDDPDAIDRGIETLYEAIRRLPVANPRIAGFVPNPPWVTKALADTYEELDDKVPARWLPQLRNVDPTRRGITAAFMEYGCGAYGCVLATMDPTTVLKVTSDETEAEFATTLAGDLAAPICVEYRLAVRLSIRHDGRQIYMLWREAADHVGKIDDVMDAGYIVDQYIDRQHRAAQRAYDLLYKGAPPQYVAEEINAWVGYCREMAEQTRIPEIRALGAGLVKVWEEQRILFGDIHAGNLGLVTRGSQKLWVITDPGNVAVVR